MKRIISLGFCSIWLLFFGAACTLSVNLDRGLPSIIPPEPEPGISHPLEKLANFSGGVGAYGWVKQGDKRVVYGDFTFSFSQEENISHLARMTPDFKLDAGFLSAPGMVIRESSSPRAEKITLLPDDSMWVFLPYSGSPGFENTLNGEELVGSFIHLDKTGHILSSRIEAPFSARHILTSDGKVVAVHADGTLDRYHLDLSKDEDFITTESFDVKPYVLLESHDGKIYVGGDFTMLGATPVPRLIRLNADGTLDSSFDVTALSDLDGSVWDLREDEDQKIWVAGDFTKKLIKLTSTGDLDNSFSVSPPLDGTVTGILAVKEGRLWVGGNFSGGLTVVEGSTGNLAAGYTWGAGFSGPVTSLKFLKEDESEVLVAGATADQFNGNDISGFAVIDPTNGQVVKRIFSSASSYSYNYAFPSLNFTEDSQGNYILWGGFKHLPLNDRRTPRIARINSDGTLDPGFQPGEGLDGAAISAVVDSQGRIVLGGDFSHYDSQSAGRIVRILKDGQRDTAFDTGTGFSTAPSVYVVSGDKYLVAGGGDYNGIPTHGLVRLNGDGSLDSGFSFGPHFAGSIFKALPLPDGKIIVYGNMSFEDGDLPSSRLVRLNVDGSLDTTFQQGVEITGFVSQLALQGGRIILVGSFTDISYNGVSSGKSRVARMNTDGLMDDSFIYSQGGPTAPYYSVLVSQNGQLLLGGFSSGVIFRVLDSVGAVINSDIPYISGPASGLFMEEIAKDKFLVSIGFMGSSISYSVNGRSGIAIWDMSRGQLY